MSNKKEKGTKQKYASLCMCHSERREDKNRRRESWEGIKILTRKFLQT